jgi:hypothetical protein
MLLFFSMTYSFFFYSPHYRHLNGKYSQNTRLRIKRQTEQVGTSVMNLAFIRVIYASNLNRNTDYPDWSSSRVYRHSICTKCAATFHHSDITVNNHLGRKKQDAGINCKYLTFQVLTAASMKFKFVFWDVLPCKIIVDRRFRWWQHVPLKRLPTIILHGSTSQKTNLNFKLQIVCIPNWILIRR